MAGFVIGYAGHLSRALARGWPLVPPRRQPLAPESQNPVQGLREKIRQHRIPRQLTVLSGIGHPLRDI